MFFFSNWWIKTLERHRHINGSHHLQMRTKNYMIWMHLSVFDNHLKTYRMILHPSPNDDWVGVVIKLDNHPFISLNWYPTFLVKCERIHVNICISNSSKALFWVLIYKIVFTSECLSLLVFFYLDLLSIIETNVFRGN